MNDSLKQQMRQQLALATQRAREAGYQDGYQAALRDLQELSSQHNQPTVPARPVVEEAKSPAVETSRPGDNAKLVAEALKHIAPRGARPAEIIETVKKLTGKTLAFSSTRHAIQQLTARNEIERVGKQSVWKHRSESAAWEGQNGRDQRENAA